MEERYPHPSFPQPEDADTVRWRYMDARKFEWLVQYKQLFMASAENLGDPHEGTTPAGELEWWKREVETATEERRKTLEHNRLFTADFARLFRPSYYVSCWHMNAYENHLMWGAYTPGTTEAVAIKTTYASLRRCLPACVNLGVVRYIDYRTERFPAPNMFDYIMHKDVHFAYEREVRAVVSTILDGDNLKEECPSKPGCFMYAPAIDPSALIEGIILHPQASSEFHNRLAVLCIQNGLVMPEPSRQTRIPVF